MINDKIYQFIYDEVSKYLTAGWDKLIVYLEYGLNSYSFSFYVKEGDDFIKCYDLPGVSDSELAESFRRIDDAVLKECNSSEDALWTSMTMTVESTGKMHTDFDYTDISEMGYQYKKEWKKKYLV